MKHRGTIGVVAVIVVGLVAIHLLGVDTSAIILVMASIGVMFIALRWIITSRPPTRNALLLVALLFIGPTLLLALLQTGMATLRTWPNRQALLLLLVIGGALFWLGRKWRG